MMSVVSQDHKKGTARQERYLEDGGGTKPQTARRWGQYVAAITATLSAFSLGNMMAWTSPASGPIRNGTFIEGTPLEAEEEAWLGALMPLGAAAFAFPIGLLMDGVGRRTAMLMLVVPFGLGWGLLAWPLTLEAVYLGRFLLGMAGGAVGVAAPVYTAEIAEAEIRGGLGTYFEIMLTLGIVFVYAVGTVVPLFTLSLLCGGVSIFFFVTFFFMPESPLYLIAKDREDDARRSLAFFRGPQFDVEPELKELRGRVEAAAEARQRPLTQRLRTKAARTGLGISLGLMVFQQLSGIDAITFYTSSIFEAAGSSLGGSLSAIVLGSVEVLATFLSSFVIDRLGRRPLLSLSSALMSLCTLLLGVFFFLQEHDHDVSDIGWLPLTSLSVYIVAFSIGLGPIPWTMVGELFPPDIQGVASGAASCLNWLLGFLVTKYYHAMKDGLGGGATFWIFAVILAGGAAFSLFVVKETKGKTAEQIQRELSGTE